MNLRRAGYRKSGVYILAFSRPGPPNLNPKLFPVGWDAEVFMTSVETRPGFAPRAMALGALAAGATAIGLLAIGWISIAKLR